MKYLSLFFLIFLICSLSGFAQTLINPESLAYDPKSKSYFVGNVGNGTVVEIDRNGTKTLFKSGLGVVMGLKIANDVLYVVEGLDVNDKIHGYELTSGKEVFLMGIKEAVELNDLEADGKGLLYASDRSGNKVFVINIVDRTYKLLLDGLIKSPNGICLDRSKKSLLICNGFDENCNIFSFHLESGKLDTLIKTNYSHLDGLITDQKGRIYFSASSKDWKTSKLVKYDDGKFEELLENKSGITDIAFNPYRRGIDMAFYYSNEIGFYRL